MTRPPDLSTEQMMRLLSSIVNDATCNETCLQAVPDDATQLKELCTILFAIRQFAFGLANGDLHQVSQERGFTMGALKSLNAHLRHLTWNLQCITEGSQVDIAPYMGDFSSVFNELSEEVHKKFLELRTLTEKYKNLAYLDALTALPNRRAFMNAALREVQICLRANRPSCLIMLDIDHFKHINDTYGHDVGDEVLKALALRFKETLRAEDLCSRFGGEEFLVLLRESTPEESQKAAERLRKACADAPFVTSQHEIMVTASLGFTQMTPHSAQSPISALAILEQAIQRADKALYIAKNAGRNRVHRG